MHFNTNDRPAKYVTSEADEFGLKICFNDEVLGVYKISILIIIL